MWHALRSLINPHCGICGELCTFVCSKRRLCQGCFCDLPWIKNHCQCCGLPLSIDVDRCGECLRRPPHYHHSAIPWVYEFPVSALIRAYKHQQRADHGKLLGSMMTEFLTTHYAQRQWPQALLPVPLHPQRLRQRGFNQAHEIAGQLAKQLHLPVLDGYVVRRENTASQQGLNRQQRKQNLKHAFSIAKTTGFRRIAIVDDVVTTGTTVDMIAAQLQRCGIAEIHIWALARTPAT